MMVREKKNRMKLGFKETFWTLVYILCTVSIQFPSVVPSYHHGNQASTVSPGTSYHYSTDNTQTELRMKAPEEEMDLMEVCTMSGGRRMCVCVPSPCCIYRAWPVYSDIPSQQLPWREQYLCRGRKETQNTFTVALVYTTTPSILPILPPPHKHTHSQAHRKKGRRYRTQAQKVSNWVCEPDYKELGVTSSSGQRRGPSSQSEPGSTSTITSELKPFSTLLPLEIPASCLQLPHDTHQCFQRLALQWCHQVSESHLSLPLQSSSLQYDPWWTHQHWNTHILPLCVQTWCKWHVKVMCMQSTCELRIKYM